MAFFQSSVLNKYLQAQNNSEIKEAFQKYSLYFHNPQRQQNIRDAKEEQFQEGFLRELFVNILGYILNPNPDFNITTELKNEKGAKKADGAILKDGKALAVIELKGTDTTDLEKINAQAFNYKNNHSNCVYVITSNFEKLRFFIHNSVNHIEFALFHLNEDQFRLLWLCLHADNLLKGIPLKIKEESLLVDEKITNQLYKDYANFRTDLWHNMVKNSSDADQLLLFKKTQKLLDRFLFILFAEDGGLLPPNSISRIVQRWNILKQEDAYKPLYDIFKQYFGYINTGRQGKTISDDIFAYNGGLFLPDEVLDRVVIDDEIIHKHVNTLTKYNFQSEVDVNILGHIFENSLNEIETITAQLEGQLLDKSKSKRKKDGVFYTPKYITKYIVDSTLGKLCTEKKAALNIVDEDFAKERKKRKKDTIKKLDEQLKAYRSWLLEISICDPACGSGAFLNQALEFLMEEHAYVDELHTKLFGSSIVFQDVSSHILEKNLFGVDINEESVEIAKLSLWLRTAQKGRKLTTLNNNIKCGNSLIDDPEVAGDKAFNWQEEFSSVFRKKEKAAFHITTATHDSRTSQRMIDYHVREKRDNGMHPKAEPIWLEPEDELLITQVIGEVVKEDALNVLAYNICGDHIHLVLVCEENEVQSIMQKIKAISAKEYNRSVGKTAIPAAREYSAREHAPLSNKKEPHISLWTQKFGCKEIESDEQLYNTIEYVQTNRLKHGLPEDINVSKGENISVKSKGACSLVSTIESFVCDYDHAFRTEYAGGFDVVIGNPPYVRQELLADYKPFFENNYAVFEGASDLFAYFYEKGFLILKEKGLFGFISNTFDKTKAANKLRDYLTSNTQFLHYVDFTEVQIFEGATTYPIILIARNKRPKDNSFDFIKIPKGKQSPVIEISLELPVAVSQASLDAESWNFNSLQGASILHKINQNKSLRQLYGKCYRGIVTGFNDAFIIDGKIKRDLENEHSSSKEIIKPFYEGKDLSKWHSEKIDKYIIFTRRGIEIENYPAILKYLEQYRERLTPRNSPEIKVGRKPGSYKWFEIQDSVDYYKIFEQPKITWPNLQSTNKFCIEDKEYYINAPSVVFPSANKTLLSILNSKVVWFFLKSICVIRSGGYIEVKPQYFEQIPIPELQNEAVFENKADQIIAKTSELQNTQYQFLDLLQSKFDIEKLTKKLQCWDELDFKGFLNELKKAKISLGLSQEVEWMKFFNEQKQMAQSLKADINRIEAEINQMVYELYGLNEEEIKIVEGN